MIGATIEREAISQHVSILTVHYQPKTKFSSFLNSLGLVCQATKPSTRVWNFHTVVSIPKPTAYPMEEYLVCFTLDSLLLPSVVLAMSLKSLQITSWNYNTELYSDQFIILKILSSLMAISSYNSLANVNLSDMISSHLFCNKSIY